MAEAKDPRNDTVVWPSVAILIPNWNGRALLETCLPPLAAQSYPNYQIILIDNHSQDDSVAYTQANYPDVHIIQNEENLGFSRGVNVGLKSQTADVVVLLNNDVIVREGWLEALIRPTLDDPQIGIAGCKLLYPDGTIQHLGGRIEYPLANGVHEHWHEPDSPEMAGLRDVEYVTGAAMAITRPVLNTVGFFDEGFTPFYYEETDYCYRARQAGFRIVVNADAAAVHMESASMEPVRHLQKYAYHKNRLRFVLKHFGAAQFLTDFAPAETNRLQAAFSAGELQSLGRVYWETAVTLPDLISENENPRPFAAVQDALLQLHQAAQMQMVRKLAQTGGPQAELDRRKTLSEIEFVSDTAVIGPLVAEFRRQWHNVAARWAVGHVMRQQNAFNQLAGNILSEANSQTKSNAADIRLLFDELFRLRREFALSMQETQAAITQLQRQLDRIEKLLTASRSP